MLQGMDERGLWWQGRKALRKRQRQVVSQFLLTLGDGGSLLSDGTTEDSEEGFCFFLFSGVSCPVLPPQTLHPAHWPFDSSYLVGWPPPVVAIYTPHTYMLFSISRSSGPLRQPILLWTHFESKIPTSLACNVSCLQAVCVWGLHEWLLSAYADEAFVKFCRVIFREA